MPKFDLHSKGRPRGKVSVNKSNVEFVREHPRRPNKCTIHLRSGNKITVHGSLHDVERKLDL